MLRIMFLLQSDQNNTQGSIKTKQKKDSNRPQSI